MLHCFVNTSDCHFILSANSLKRFFITSLCYPLVTKESLFCHQREPLFSKSGKSDFFCLKKLAMSLIRAIFALETDERWPISDSSSQSAFALPSLCLHSGFASGGEEKHKAMRQQRQGTNKSSLTDLLRGFRWSRQHQGSTQSPFSLMRLTSSSTAAAWGMSRLTTCLPL